MAISSDDLRQRFLANILQQGAPQNLAGGISSLGTSLASLLAAQRQIPAAEKREADLEAKETADRIGGEVALRDALVSAGIDPSRAGGIASAPEGARGALLGLLPKPAAAPSPLDVARLGLERTRVEQTGKNQELSREIDRGRLRVAERQASTAELRAKTAAEEAGRSDAQVETVRMRDGTVRSFRRDDPQLDAALQEGGVRFSAQVQAGDVGGIGGATTSSKTKAQQTIDSSTATLGTIQQLRETLRPENVGISGNVRELGIGALGQVEAFRAWADGQTQQIIDDAIQSGDTLDLSRFAVDPDLSAQRVLQNIIVYQYSKAIAPGDRITDQDFRKNEKALGFGNKLASIGDLFARLDAVERVVKRTQGIAERRLGVTGDQGQATSQPEQEPTRIRFDAQGNIVQ